MLVRKKQTRKGRNQQDGLKEGGGGRAKGELGKGGSRHVHEEEIYVAPDWIVLTRSRRSLFAPIPQRAFASAYLLLPLFYLFVLFYSTAIYPMVESTYGHVYVPWVFFGLYRNHIDDGSTYGHVFQGTLPCLTANGGNPVARRYNCQCWGGENCFLRALFVY